MAKNVAISAAMSDKELLDSIDKTLKQAEKRFDTFAAKATSSLSSLEKASFSIGSNIGKSLADGFNQNSVDLLNRLQQVSSKITKINSKSGTGPTSLFAVNVNELNEAITKTDALTKNFKEMAASTSQINKNLKGINAARTPSKAAMEEARITLEMEKQHKWQEQAIRYRKQALDIAQRTAKEDSRRRITTAGASYDSAMAMSAKTIQERMDKLKALQIVQRNLSTSDAQYATQLKALNREMANLRKANKEAEGSGVELLQTNSKLMESFKNLGKRVVFYAGLGALGAFSKGILQIRGQYELLERSIGAVLGDFEKGSQIFREQQKLALESPFTVLDLAGATKQLAAYNFAAEELVDTSRRLADISAALGVPMERLTYNLGQIKAQTVLMARDARDFANAGLPITQELANMYSELEGRAVSVGEVMDRMSNRMVSFGDVMKVINRYTDQGGMFFDFQAKQAKTLAGQLSNLTDAYNNMLNEIGKETQGVLSGGISLTRKFFDNWRLIVNILSVASTSTLAYIAVNALMNISVKNLNLSLDKFNTYMKVAIARLHSKALADRVATMSGEGLNKTLLAIAKNPYALIVAGLTAAGLVIYKAYQNANKLKNELDSIITSGSLTAQRLVADFDALIRKLNSSTKGSEDFNSALKEINNTYGQYLPNLLTELNYTKELEKNYNNVVAAIYNKSKAQALEKSYQTIEEQYGPKQQESIQSIVTTLSSDLKKGLSKVDVQQIIKNFVGGLDKGLAEGETYAKRFYDTMEAYLGDSGKTKKVFQNYGAQIFTSVQGLGEAYKGQKDAINDVREMSDIMYGEATYKSKEEGKLVDAVNEKFKTLAQTEENQIKKLKELQKIYKDAGDTYFYDDVTKQLAKYNVQLDKWKETVKDIIKAAPKGAGAAFDVQPDDNSVQYIDRLKKSYADLLKQRETLAGTKTDDITKQRVEDQIKVIIAIGKALNVNLASQKQINKEENEETKLLKQRLSLIKDIAKSNEDLVKRTGNLTYAAEKTKEAYQDMFNTLMKGKGIDFSDALSFNPASMMKIYDKLAEGLKSEQAKNALGKQRSKFMIEYSVQINTASLNAAEKAIQGMFQGYELELDVQGAGQFGSLFQSLFDYDPVTIDQLNEDVSNVLAGLEDQIKEYTNRKGVLGDIITGSGDQSAVDAAKAELNKIETLESNTAKYIEKIRKQLNDTNAKYYADNFKTYQKIYNDFATYEDKRAEIERKRLEEQAALAVEVERQTKKRDQLKTNLSVATDPEQKEKIQKDLDNLQKYLDNTPLKLSVAIDNKAKQDQAKLDFDTFKETELYQKSFEDLANISTGSLDMLMVALDELKEKVGASLSPTDMKTFMNTYKQVRDEVQGRDIFGSLISNTKDWIAATKEVSALKKQLKDDNDALTEANKQLASAEEKASADPTDIQAQTELGNAIKKQADAQEKVVATSNDLNTANDKQKKSWQGMVKDINNAQQAIDGINSLLGQVNELLGITEDSEAGQAMKAFSQGLSLVSTALGVAAAAMIAFNTAALPILAIGAAVAAVIGSILFFTGKKDRAITKEIEKSERAVARLENAYKDLERTVKQSLGTSETLAKKAAIANQRLQLVELKRQLTLERSRKGKKRDEDKIIDLEGQVKDLENTIKDATQSIVDDMLGSNIKDAAEEFADNWIDAWKNGEDTMQSIEEGFSDMIDNMIVKSMASTVVANRLKQMYGMVEKFMDKNSAGGEAITADEARQMAELSKQLTPLINEDLKNIMGSLGIAFGSGVKDAALSSLEKGISSITEETAGALEALLGNIMGQVFKQTAIQQQMVDLLNVNTGTNSQILLTLRAEYQILQSIQIWANNITTAAGNGINVRILPE